jgi:hypothetical protein
VNQRDEEHFTHDSPEMIQQCHVNGNHPIYLIMKFIQLFHDIETFHDRRLGWSTFSMLVEACHTFIEKAIYFSRI